MKYETGLQLIERASTKWTFGDSRLQWNTISRDKYAVLGNPIKQTLGNDWEYLHKYIQFDSGSVFEQVILILHQSIVISTMMHNTSWHAIWLNVFKLHFSPIVYILLAKPIESLYVLCPFSVNDIYDVLLVWLGYQALVMMIQANSML